MSQLIFFKPKSMNASQYEEVMNKLKKAGTGNPAGRILHACYGTKNNLNVVGIWDSKENFEKFGAALSPVLQQLGIEAGAPEVNDIYNVIQDNNSAQENLKIVREFYDEFNNRNFSKVQKIIDDNAQFHLIPFGTEFSGKEGYLQVVEGWANAFPDGQCHITNITADENGAVAEFAGRGTQTGTLKSPEGDILPTGKYIDVLFCDTFKIKKGKVISYNSYFDVSTMLRQLGLIPELKSH